jgi:hypothetical protein
LIAPRLGWIFFRSLILCFRAGATAAPLLLRWTAEAAFTTAFTTRGTAEATRAARRATRPAGRAAWATAHHAAHPLNARPHLFLADFTIGIFIHAGKAAFDFLLGKFHILLFVHAAVAILIDAAKNLIGVDSWATRTTWGHGAIPFRAWAGAVAFRAWARSVTLRAWAWLIPFLAASWRTAEAALATLSPWAAEASGAPLAYPAHAFTQALSDLCHLRLFDIAIAIGIHFGKTIAIVALGEFVELFLADLSVVIGIRAFEEFSQAAASFTFRRAFLRSGQASAEREGAQAHVECVFGFHGWFESVWLKTTQAFNQGSCGELQFF